MVEESERKNEEENERKDRPLEERETDHDALNEIWG